MTTNALAFAVLKAGDVSFVPGCVLALGISFEVAWNTAQLLEAVPRGPLAVFIDAVRTHPAVCI